MATKLLTEEIEALTDECQYKLRGVEADLIEFTDGNIEASPEFVSRLFRAVHGVKDAAGYLHFDSLTQLSLVAEQVLTGMRNGQIELSLANAGALLAAADRMMAMVADGVRRSNVEFSVEMEKLNNLLNSRPAPAGEQRPMAPVGVAGKPPRGSLKVLLVEDDFTCRVVLQGLLSKHGECHIAVNGQEAVDAFRTARQEGTGYDLICMDIQLPEMDGQEAVRQIRALEEGEQIYVHDGVKIFMTTGIQNIKTVMDSFKSLCDAYLFKPIDGTKLEEHLRSFSLIGRE